MPTTCPPTHQHRRTQTAADWVTFESAAPEGNLLWNAKRWRLKGHAVLMSAAAAAAVAVGTHVLSKCNFYNHKIETVAKVECNLTFGKLLSGCWSWHS